MTLEPVQPELVEDLYPRDEDEQAKQVSDWIRRFNIAQQDRQPYEDKWDVYYRLYRSHVAERTPGDWHSKVFIPLIFFTIQTILPRLVAGLPKGIVYPVEAADADGAVQMEDLLEWATQQSELDLELVKAYWSALVYGTGILKTSPKKRARMRKREVEKVESYSADVQSPVIDPETGDQAMDMEGQPQFETKQVPLGVRPMMGPDGMPVTETIEEEAVGYVGPYGEAVDIYNVFPAPEAQDVQQARYIIHRDWVDRQFVMDRVDDGTYRLPQGVTIEQFWSVDEDPVARRRQRVDLGGSHETDSTREVSEIWECWSRDGTVTTIVNRKWVVRVVENPYEHGEFPFSRIVDVLNPFEFWGTGEVEHLEGIQDATNAIWNQRIDNIRLILNKMFFVRVGKVADMDDLRSRPGGIIRVQGDEPLEDTVAELQLSDVTGSSYEEVNALMDLAKTISGANDYTSGQSPEDATNQTATGAAILTEQGNIRFSMKVQLAEMTGLKSLYRQYGALLQQFTPQEIQMRIIGSDGSVSFQPIEPAALMGAFDYDIEAESSTQTESMRKEQSMSLLQLLAGTGRVDIDKLITDVLRAFNKKNPQDYLLPPPMPVMDPNTGMMIDPTTGAPAQDQSMAAQQQMGALPPPMTGMEAQPEPSQNGAVPA